MTDSPENTPFDITPESKIGPMLDAYPALEEVLIAHAPVFRKLRNPILRRTVARVTTVTRAAGVAEVPAGALVRVLREAAGLPNDVSTPLCEEETDASQARPNTEPPQPRWITEGEVVATFDADKLLEAGTVPLVPVMQRARALLTGELLRIDASFRPTPLLEEVQANGFRCHVEKAPNRGFSTYVAPAPAQSP